MSLYILVTGACDNEDPISGTVWYTHSVEEDVEHGKQDIVWKLAFAEDNKVSIVGSANDAVFNMAEGTYTVSDATSVNLNLFCVQSAAERTLDFKTFSALADGRWRLDYFIRYNYGTTQDHVMIFVKGRIPSPEEVMGL